MGCGLVQLDPRNFLWFSEAYKHLELFVSRTSSWACTFKWASTIIKIKNFMLMKMCKTLVSLQGQTLPKHELTGPTRLTVITKHKKIKKHKKHG